MDEKWQRRLRAAVIFLCFDSVPSMGMSDHETMRSMNGAWVGEGTPLVIDTQRLQANLDPEKPFEWQTFRILNITGSMITFDIGPRRFMALLGGEEEMHLTELGAPHERLLHKVKSNPLPKKNRAK